MKIVSKIPKERKTVDYSLLADYYNRCELEEAVELKKVYNVSLFKITLSNKGIVPDEDFQAFNKGEKTYVKRLTTKRMSKD